MSGGRTDREAAPADAGRALSVLGDAGGLGDVSALDAGADWLGTRARSLSESAAGPVLRGEWMGHSLHPMLTDVTVGCWTSAAIVDLVGGGGGRSAARRLVGIGVLCALPTAASGLVEYATIRRNDDESRRIGAAHAGLNLVAIVSYARSWMARRRGHHLRGLAWSGVGALAASGSGHLGGHLAFVKGIGQGARRSPDRRGQPADVDVRDARDREIRGEGELVGIDSAADTLGMTSDSVREMVKQGLLVPVVEDPPAFRSSDLQAVRLQGG